MRIHPAGYIVIFIVALIVAAILYAINWIFPAQTFVHYFLYAVAAVFMFLVVRFFRRPRRLVPAHEEFIFSAADGNVVAIEEVIENEYFRDKRKQVSVFMSLVNAHINWYPVTGKVKYVHHKAGKFYAAYLPKSSEENERNSVVIEDPYGREIMVRQIAGAAARRIVCKTKEGQEVEQGSELGMIRFGSRVDLFLPLDAEITVKLNQEVRGNTTLMAKMPVPKDL